jgi:hypothetical protein
MFVVALSYIFAGNVGLEFVLLRLGRLGILGLELKVPHNKPFRKQGEKERSFREKWKCDGQDDAGQGSKYVE